MRVVTKVLPFRVNNYVINELIDWNNIPAFINLFHLIKGIALAKGIKLRWGGDWDGDGDMTDQTLHDKPHFELMD